jgi:O-antigen/teichoic acid export membrane protein
MQVLPDADGDSGMRTIGTDQGRVSRDMEGRADGSRMIDNISVLTLAQIFYRLVSLAISFVLARYLGLIEQGAYVLVLSYAAVFGSFADLGIANLVIRDMNQRNADPSELVSSYLSLLVIVNIGLLLASVGWSVVIGYEPRLVVGIALAGLGSLFVGITAAYYAVLAGKVRMRRIALNQVLNTLAIAAGMAIVMLSGGTLVPLTAVAAATGAISLMLHRIPATSLVPGIRLSFHPGRAFALMVRGLPFTLHVGLYVILTRVDVLFVKKLADEYALGVYTAATRLTYPMTIVSMMTAVAIFPVVSRYVYENVARAHGIVLRSMLRLGAIGIAIAVLVTFGASVIIRMLYGSQFLGAAPVLTIAIWYIPLFYFHQVVSDLLVASNKVWGIVWITVACLVLSVLLNLILIPRHGAFGAAWTTVICEGVRCAAIIIYAVRALGFPRPQAAA